MRDDAKFLTDMVAPQSFMTRKYLLVLLLVAGTIEKTAASLRGTNNIMKSVMKLTHNSDTAKELAPPFYPTISTSFGLLNGFYAETTSTPILPPGTCEGWCGDGVLG